ncbi:hypothetical protein B0H13DRAFT_1967577 [Mycena leptocephala]|nr:hypothetical protein B0H13DRAFT_1967577 [Mycena leptocephala]
MGLSGRKEKQRIGADPRNLTWADDAAKFGSSYLSKFGWDPSKGLGESGEGRMSHIKVSQKLDMLGIGAAQQKDPNGIAWKQNKDFERLLERLNADQGVKAEGDDEDEKKRKREDGDETAVKKKRRKSEPVAEVVVAETVKPVVPRHRAFRARAIAAKNIASKSAASIAEILGVAPTPSTTATATPEGTLTPYEDGVPLEKLTTSTKSVADYFKDKLLAKAGKSGSATPTPFEAIKTEMDYDAPRGGLGSSRVKLEPKDDDPDVKVEEEYVKVDTKRNSSVENDTGKRKDKRASGTNSEAVGEDERKRAKQERKRLKALKKEQADKEKEEDALKADPVDEAERKRAKKERKRLKALKKGQAVEE